jgi:hypothetical protein
VEVDLNDEEVIEALEDDFRLTCEDYIPSAQSRYIIKHNVVNALDTFESQFPFETKDGRKYMIEVGDFTGQIFGGVYIDDAHDGTASVKYEGSISLISPDKSKITEYFNIEVR